MQQQQQNGKYENNNVPLSHKRAKVEKKESEIIMPSVKANIQIYHASVLFIEHIHHDRYYYTTHRMEYEK